MNQKNYPAGSVAAAGQWGKKCDVRSRASNTWLGFRRGVALFAVKAFLVNDLPVLIGLAGFELHWFQQMRQIGSRGLEVTDVSGMLGKNWSPGANHQIAHKRPTPRDTAAEGCVERLLSRFSTRDAPLNTKIGTAVTETGTY